MHISCMIYGFEPHIYIRLLAIGWINLLTVLWRFVSTHFENIPAQLHLLGYANYAMGYCQVLSAAISAHELV